MIDDRGFSVAGTDGDFAWSRETEVYSKCLGLIEDLNEDAQRRVARDIACVFGGTWRDRMRAALRRLKRRLLPAARRC